MRTTYISLICISLSCLFAACSSVTNTKTVDREFKVAEISIYMHRANMNSTDFEQYKLSANRLFQECSVILRGKNVATEQQLFDISTENNTKIMELTWKLLDLAHKGQAALEEPGSSSNFFDPGFLGLKITGNNNTIQLKTSVDATVEGTSSAAKIVNQITRSLRTLGKPAACGNRDFYGLIPIS